MLGTFLEKLQALLSKSFLIASFFPVLIFATINSVLLYTQSALFASFVRRYLAGQTGLIDSVTVGMTALVALGIVAFLFSMLNTRLREILEGRRFWPRVLAAPFIWRQTRRRDAIQIRYDRAQKERRDVVDAVPVWTRDLRAARILVKPAGTRCQYPWGHAVARRLRALRWQQHFGLTISKASLEKAANALGAVLRASNVDEPPQGDERDARRLDGDHDSLPTLADYAVSRCGEDIYQFSGELQFSFPGRALAPTAMGNVANSIPSYAFTRYRMNIDLFWTRLQEVMQPDPFYAVLQDAKTQLDFLVSLVWLATATTAGWLPFLAFRSTDLWAYLIVAVAGPLSVTTFNGIAIQNYRAFADLVRSAVDLYRMDLLKALKVGLPDTSSAEGELWAILNRRMSYAGNATITYDKGALK